MRLSELIKELEPVRLDADPAIQITGIAYDSRRVEPGFLFAAVQGFKADGHDFVPRAAAAGAAAILTSRWLGDAGIAQIQVVDVRKAMAYAASRFYGAPSRNLRLAGITGTNGKTTTSYMLHSILETAGRQTALIGGVEYRVAGRSTPAARTTPESVELQRMLAEAVAGGDADAVLEVSSHGIGLHRVTCLEFDVAVFTNLTSEHIDLHGDMEEYYATKRRLFLGETAGRPGGGVPLAVVNIDDVFGERLAGEVESAGGKTITFSAASSAVISARDILYTGWETSFELVTPAGSVPIRIGIPGSFNLANALASAGAAFALEVPVDAIARGLEGHRGAPGRFEPVDLETPYRVVIDYAHNVDGLARAIETARALTAGRLIVVFGCPGERDREKRPHMGRTAGSSSDLAILTTDDCYGEPPEQILDEAEAGLRGSGGRFLRIPDRREAIAAALDEAEAGDTVLIAGKGHETRQIMADGPVPFNDREVVRELAGEPGR